MGWRERTILEGRSFSVVGKGIGGANGHARVEVLEGRLPNAGYDIRSEADTLRPGYFSFLWSSF
jgi:hypothetical protein